MSKKKIKEVYIQKAEFDALKEGDICKRGGTKYDDVIRDTAHQLTKPISIVSALEY